MYVALYINVNLMVRSPKAIYVAIETVQKHELVLKIVEGPQDDLSCKVKFSTDKKHLFRMTPPCWNYRKKFDNWAENFSIVLPVDNMEANSAED